MAYLDFSTGPRDGGTWSSEIARRHRSTVQERLTTLLRTASPANQGIVHSGPHRRMAGHLLEVLGA